MKALASSLFFVILFLAYFCWTHAWSDLEVGGLFNAPVQSARLKSIENLLLSYKRVHSADSIKILSPREICARQYVVTQVACRDAGNSLGTYLDNLAWAVILNRTIVAHWNPKTNLCHGAVKLKDWVITTAELNRLQDSAGCARDIPDLRLHGNPGIIGCCNIDSLNSTFLNPGRTYKLAFEKYRPVEGRRNVLNSAVAERANLLFSNNRALSSYETYGLLTMFGIEFTEIAEDHVRGLIPVNKNPGGVGVGGGSGARSKQAGSSYDDELLIGIQVRHQKREKGFEKAVDLGFEKCLRTHATKLIESTRKSSSRRQCSLLIATDRIETLERFEQVAKSLGCRAKYVRREKKISRREQRGEHGPWGESAISMADLYLLSHSHYFFGTKVSSFSALMMNMVAARAAIRGEQRPFAWGVLVNKLSEKTETDGPPCAEYTDGDLRPYNQDVDFCANAPSEQQKAVFHNANLCTKVFSGTTFSLVGIEKSG
jgi:hypothetical protein